MRITSYLHCAVPIFILFFISNAAFAENINVTLSWTDNSDNEDNFVIEHHTAGNSFAEIGQTQTDVNSYNTQLDNSVTNYYRVYAKNGEGNSGYSNVALYTIPGDVDGDGTVNLSDAITSLQVVGGIENSGEVHIESDINADDKVGLPESINALKTAAE
jgi:hypothetical protein